MTSLAHLLASIALALPAIPPGDEPSSLPDMTDSWAAAVAPEGPPLAPRVLDEGPIATFSEGLPEDTWAQVRIEQQLIIRITPRANAREPAVVQPSVTYKFRERKTANCMPARGIAAVRPISDSRLLLFMRDSRLIGATLPKVCNARDFYLGFYLSQPADGQICVGRDLLHSRAGSSCVIAQVRELVPGE